MGQWCSCCIPKPHLEEERTPLAKYSRDPYSQDTSSSSPHTQAEEEALLKGKKLFNQSPKEGIKYLQSHQLLGPEPADLAQFLKEATFLDKAVIGDYLGDKKPLNAQVLEEYVKMMDFRGLAFDVALRRFMGEGFRLPGEAQKIDRIMESFARHYCLGNPQIFASPDVAYVLAFSLIMLNTDLHNPSVKKKISKEGFIRNNRGINVGKDLPEEYLGKLYDSFRSQELHLVEGLRFDDTSYTFYHPEKSGHLLKLGSKMTSWSKRYFLINNNCLYYFTNEGDKDPRGIVPLENLSVRALDPQSDLRGAHCFEIYDEEARSSKKSIKSVKFKNGSILQGKRTSYTLACASEEDRDDWINALTGNTRISPLQHLVKQKVAAMPGHRESTVSILHLTVKTDDPIPESPQQDHGQEGIDERRA